MSAEENITTVRKSVQAQNARDFDAFKDLVAPNFVRHELAHMFGSQKG